MKNLILTVLLTAAVSQVQAGGFYQDIVGQAPQNSKTAYNVASDFSYSPLYLQVTGNGERVLDLNEEINRTASNFTYTPLYLKVIGDMS